MTVISATNNETFIGNGVTTIWDLPFRFFSNGDVFAYLIDPVTKVITPLVQGTDYGLTGAGLPEQFGTAPGKIVTAVPVPNLTQLFVERIMDIEQLTDIINQGRFFPEVHEDVFDRLTMLIQQTNSNANGAIRVAVGDPEPKRLPPAADRPGLLMSFDNNGDPLLVAPASGSATDLALQLADNVNPALGAGMVGYHGRTVHAKLDDVVSVKDFGAVGDGVADDYAAITAAFAATPDGGRLEMNGTFATSAKLVFDPYRAMIIGNPTIVPFGSYSDYLVEFGKEGANDPLVPDLGNKVNIQSMTIDGKLKARGVKMIQVYNSAIFDLSVFRAWGTSLRMEGSMEDSFHGLLLEGSKSRQASWVGTQGSWNAGVAYTVGQVVMISYPAYNAGTNYAIGDMVTSGLDAWRATVVTLGVAPAVGSPNWEWIPFEYFQCQIAHTNRNPHNPAPWFTTRDPVPANRYWKQVFADEPVLDLNQTDHPYPVNNISFYGHWIRHCENVPLVRIDSNKDANSVTDINFFGGQTHMLLPEYITAYDARYPLEPCGFTMPKRGLLLEVGSVIDFNIFGGNWRCGESANAKCMQLGWRNPGKGSQGIGLIGPSFNGDGNNMIGLSAMPSFGGVAIKVADLFFRFNGTNTRDVVDPLKALVHKSRLGVNYNDRVIINEDVQPSITVGKANEAGQTTYAMRTSGLGSAYDSRIRSVGGTATVGQGEFNIDAATLRMYYGGIYEAFRISGIVNGANLLVARNNVAGSPPILEVGGTETNADILIRGKGTGNVRFGTVTATADAPITSYITIKDEAGVPRKLAVIT